MESNITLAREEMERASEKYKWSEKLFAEKYISQTELETDRLTKKRAELDHELSVAARDLLRDFTYHRTLAQLKSDIDQTRMALDRVRRKAQADIIQAEADLKAKDLAFKQQKDKLEKTEQQIEKTKIHAPIDGMVIYATSAKGSWRGNQEPLDEGQIVRERQELIYLPTANAMVAKVKIHESNLDKIDTGLPVEVKVDALPEKSFTGKVATIAPLPDAQSLWLNPDLKIYSTHINLDGTAEGLRTGMSCRATIIMAQYDDAVYVPVQSILKVGRQPTAFVLHNNEVENRPVKIGLDNNSMVRIISGLEPGEKVLLAPPLAQAAKADDAPSQKPADMKEPPPGRPKNNTPEPDNKATARKKRERKP